MEYMRLMLRSCAVGLHAPPDPLPVSAAAMAQHEPQLLHSDMTMCACLHADMWNMLQAPCQAACLPCNSLAADLQLTWSILQHTLHTACILTQYFEGAARLVTQHVHAIVSTVCSESVTHLHIPSNKGTQRPPWYPHILHLCGSCPSLARTH